VVIDASAFVAITAGEPEAEDLLHAVIHSSCLIGTPTILEAHLALTRIIGDRASELVERALLEFRAQVVAFDGDHANVARAAYSLYGEGRHKAALNFGDCMSYAVAKLADRPLLFIGDDFTHTDIRIGEWRRV
jgi:ribonuclease VapC